MTIHNSPNDTEHGLGARHRLAMARNGGAVVMELRARGMCLRARAGSAISRRNSPSADADFDVELVMPLSDPSTVIHVRDET